MKKIFVGAVIALLILIGFTIYVYEKAHTVPPAQVINNTQSQGPQQKYIPRIPLPSSYPEQPASPVPAAAEPYMGTWVVKNVVGAIPYPATDATSYAPGRTITIEPNLFINDAEMYPEEMKNPQYSILYPSTSELENSYGGGVPTSPGQLGIYGGVETLVVNTYGSVPNPDPKFNFGAVFLMGNDIVVDANGVFFNCVRKS